MEPSYFCHRFIRAARVLSAGRLGRDTETLQYMIVYLPAEFRVCMDLFVIQ